MLKPGLYERLVDEELQALLAEVEKRGDLLTQALLAELDGDDWPLLMARYVAEKVRQILPSVADRKEPPDACAAVAERVNRMLEALRAAPMVLPPRMLLGIDKPGGQPLKRPQEPLSRSLLFTGARTDPTLDNQIAVELASADRVDVLMSFIKYSGLALVLPALEAFIERGGRLRVITTSYMGASDAKAVQRLAELTNSEVRVSYDTSRTRLHAKAWMFWRESGYSTACVGSSNMTRPAMTQGLEWNLRVSTVESPAVFDKFAKTFETYWADAEFELFDASREADRTRLERALSQERGEGPGADALRFLVDVSPHPFQQEILEELDAARLLRAEWQNLVVAATGTGKTMIAAFDYKRLAERKRPERARLLFLAHRREILEQAQACFRTVLRDANLGELVVDGRRSQANEHVFASVQSLGESGLLSLPPDHFDMVIVDEAHHITASSYRPALERFKPRVLLGLTATPERADGERIEPDFGDRITAELRLPDAVERKYLCPFHYFCVTDAVDYSRIEFRRGRYDTEQLDKVVTGNDLRVDLVLRALDRYVADRRRVRAVGFCVSIAHAEFMADRFRRVGLSAQAVTGQTPDEERRSVRRRLENGELAYVFTVDLFNEGIDIPSLDAALFLRPTESLTVFLQQLGRGLRHADGKDCLTVLDFVGHAHKQFRYGDRLRALVGRSSLSIEKELEAGFPHLPTGCSIQMEKVAKDHILENIRGNILTAQKKRLLGAIRDFPRQSDKSLTLQNFVDFHHLELRDLYKAGKQSWSSLCAEAGVKDKSPDPDEKVLLAAPRRLSHHDSPVFLQFLKRWCDERLSWNEVVAADIDRIRGLMAHYVIWNEVGHKLGMRSLEESRERLLRNRRMASELNELALVLTSRIRHVPPAMPVAEYDLDGRGGSRPPIPLELHCQYRREEALAALGHWTWESRPEMREGVLHLPHLSTDAFFVTVNKPEKEYKESTRYDDYAVSETRFHWQSQSTTSIDSKTGRRYVEHQAQGQRILLFARIEAQAEDNRANAYVFLGPMRYETHEGSRPISITWQLMVPMPPGFYCEASKLGVAL